LARLNLNLVCLPLPILSQEQTAEGINKQVGAIDFKPRATLGKVGACELHSILELVAKLAPSQLERPAIPHLKALLKAYVLDDKELADVKMSGAKEADKPRMAAALKELVLKNPDGFRRYNGAAFGAAEPEAAGAES
jgi:hypothetical protein